MRLFTTEQRCKSKQKRWPESLAFSNVLGLLEEQKLHIVCFQSEAVLPAALHKARQAADEARQAADEAKLATEKAEMALQVAQGMGALFLCGGVSSNVYLKQSNLSPVKMRAIVHVAFCTCEEWRTGRYMLSLFYFFSALASVDFDCERMRLHITCEAVPPQRNRQSGLGLSTSQGLRLR